MGVMGNYTMLSLGSILSIFQILSMFGIANELNMMVWMWTGMIAMVVSMAGGAMSFWAYDTLHSSSEANKETLMGKIEDDWTMHSIMSTANGMTLYQAVKGWKLGQMYMMCDGDLKKCAEDKKMKKMQDGDMSE